MIRLPGDSLVHWFKKKFTGLRKNPVGYGEYKGINTVKDHSIHAGKNIQTGFPWSMAFRVRFITNDDDFSQFMGVLNYCLLKTILFMQEKIFKQVFPGVWHFV